MLNTIPIEVKKQCIDLTKEGKTSKEVYTDYYSKMYNTNYEGFRSMLKRWKKKSYADNKILEKGNLDYRFKPHGSTVQIDKNGDIIQSWIKSKTEDKLYLELIENIKKLPSLEIHNNKAKVFENFMLEVPLYDMHWGIGTYEYYKKTLQETINIINSKQYKEICIIIGQDLFHNDDFRGRTSSGTEIDKIDMVKAWNDARQFYYNIIDAAIKQSEIVKVIYSKGNHDESMSWAFVQMIKAQYNIIIDDSLKDRKLITYGSNFIGITHGDKVKGKSIKLRSIYSIEYPIEFARSKVREIHAGHLHHEREEDIYGIMCRTLSSGNITDDWHYNKGFVGQHKRFTIFEWTTDKLKSIHYV